MNSPATFRTAVVAHPGDEDAITFIDAPVTEPGVGEVRVRIAAAPVNPADLATRAGVFHRLGFITQQSHVGLGWDFAGVVDAVGPGVDLPLGARVAGLIDGFDRDFGSYAELVTVPATAIAAVPEGLDLVDASTVPLNALTARQLVDLLGDGDARSLLVTGAAGAVGAYVVSLAGARGWVVTGLARAQDEEFVRGLGADFTNSASGSWDAVADPAGLQERGVALVRDGGLFVGVQSGAVPTAERGVTTTAVAVHSDGEQLADLLRRTVSGELPARVHAVLPLDAVADAHRAVAKGGVRGRYVLQP